VRGAGLLSLFAAMTRPTIADLRARSERGEPLALLTAYDSAFARLAEAAGIDLLLVGDSVGPTMLGLPSAIPVTMEDMLHHTRAVVRGTQAAHVICDLPFLSYHGSEDEAVRNAGRALQEAGAQSVKFEGGARWTPFVQRCTDAGIPIMGHLGPRGGQSSLPHGITTEMALASATTQLVDDALALERAGVWALLLERLPHEIAQAISGAVRIPTIGIGSGPHCRGQAQVMHDVLGLFGPARPPHAARCAELAAPIRDAFAQFAAETRAGTLHSRVG
jgi:3-methyl-2-oxobutanoate hydroxymethyltransferase